jgi:hypothetical protein
MLNEFEPPITLAELTELQELELSARNEMRDDFTRSIRSRLEGLRAGKSSRRYIEHSPDMAMETRVAALEADVARLRALIEGRA